MAESDWLLTGIIIGVLIGIPLGFILVQIAAKPAPGSVVFDRDQESKLITGIHYVPLGAKS